MLAETVHEYGHGRFRMVALATVRLSESERLVHDRFAWVARGETEECPLALADVRLVEQLMALGHWRG